MASGRKAINIHTKVEEIKYPVNGEYVEDLKEILTELVGSEATESLDDHKDEELGDTDDENCEYNEIIE